MDTMIKRFYINKISTLVEQGKVLVVYGPRQVGKTTLIKEFLNGYGGKVYSGTGENAPLAEVLESHDVSKITSYFSGYDLIFIDEAQRIEKIGLALKLVVDNLPSVRVIATGSSSFELSNKIGEPLVGRQRIITLYPLSVMELILHFGGAFPHEHLEQLLVFGGYPEVLTAPSLERKKEILTLLRDGYLYRDILELEQIQNSKKILDLLRLIAFQIGNEVSIQELGTILGMNRKTVERYLDLLEKSFVLFNVRGFSKNLRSEVTKTSRYYFYDLGVRNAVIDNFNTLNVRSGDDIGMLWENFIVIERMKKRMYKNIYAHSYFWRTWQQQEIDLVEEHDGMLCGYEIKYTKTKAKTPPLWKGAYPDASFEVINKDNYIPFVT